MEHLENDSNDIIVRPPTKKNNAYFIASLPIFYAFLRTHYV